MNYEVQIRDARPETLVTMRKHTTLAKLPETLGDALKTIVASIGPKGSWPVGAPFVIYHNEPFDPKDVDVEMGFPVSRRVELRGDGAGPEVHDAPGGRIAFTVHAGSYASIGAAYEALFRWIRDHELEPAGPPREVYVVGPEQAKSPEGYRTEIDVPIR